MKDVPDVDEAMTAVERLIRANVGEPVTLDRHDAIGRAITVAHMAACDHSVEGLMRDVKDDTDDIENALLALWHNDGDDPRILTAEMANKMVTRLDGGAADLPRPSVRAFDAADNARDSKVGKAVKRFVQFKTAEAAWDVVEGDRRAAKAALAALPDDMAEELAERIRERREVGDAPELGGF